MKKSFMVMFMTANEVVARESVSGRGEHQKEQRGEKIGRSQDKETWSSSEPVFNGLGTV